MTHLEPPPPSSADLPPEKPPETEISGPSTHRAKCSPSSTGIEPEDRHAKVMENFKGMIFKFVIASSATRSMSSRQRSLIEQRLDEFFPSFCTPDHPPYAAMIEAAIQMLDEGGASSEDAISQFIKNEYPDLPWAHDSLLKHHLENLCENGSIVKASNGCYMLGHVVNKHISAPSLCSSIDEDSSLSLSPSCSPSSSSWPSSSSCCSSPRLKRKRPLYTTRRKKRGRKRGSKNKQSNEVNHMRCAQVPKRRPGRPRKCALVPKRRPGRPRKKDVWEDETETNTEHVMSGLRAQNRREGCQKGAEGINQVRGRQRKIRKPGKKQETRLVVDIQLDKREDMVDEEQRDLQAQQGNFFIRDNNQAEAIEIQCQVQDYHEEAKKEQGCQLIEQMQTKVITGLHQEGEAEKGEQEAFLKEGRREVAAQGCQVIEEESLLRKTNFQAIKEQSQVEGGDIVSPQDHRNKKKRTSHLQNRGVKGRKADLKPTSILRRRGRPRKNILLVEKTQPHAEQMIIEIQDPMLEEKTEVPREKCKINKESVAVVEDQDQLQGNMQITLEWSPAEDTLTASEIEKSGSFGEANQRIKEVNFVMEIEPQKHEGVKECDEQKEHENFEGIKEQSLLEEQNIVPEQEQSNGQKRKGRQLKRSAKRRKVPLKPTRILGSLRGRPCKKDLFVEKNQPNEEQMEKIDGQDPVLEEKTEVPVQKYETDKELTEAIEEHNQSQGNETLDGSPAGEAEIVKEIENPGLVSEEKKQIKLCNLVMEGEPQNDEATEGCNEQRKHDLLGSGEKTQLEEPNMVPKQDQRNRENRKSQLLGRGAKGRKVHLKNSCIPRRGMGGPCKKDFLVDKTRANVKQIETTDIQDPMSKENPEVPGNNCEISEECVKVVEDCSKLKESMLGTLEWNQAGETKTVKEVRRLGPVAEENGPLIQHCFVSVGEQQEDWGVKEFHEEKEHKKAFDEAKNQSAKEKIEMSFGENQPKRQENDEQNQQLEKHMKLVTEKEEVPEMHGQNIQIQENIQTEGQYESITKSLLLVDVDERTRASKAIILLKKSFGSVLEGGKEIASESNEQQKETPGKERVLEIGGSQTEVIEQKPESSTASTSQLKPLEGSSQPECLQQQQLQHADEKLQDGQLHSRLSKSFSSCGML